MDKIVFKVLKAGSSFTDGRMLADKLIDDVISYTTLSYGMASIQKC